MLLLDKPAGISSNRALQQTKCLLNARKAGHTGSLDPIATGLLPLCFGHATKVSGLFLDSDKSYDVDIVLGISTDSGDCEGNVIRNSEVHVTEPELRKVLDHFLGPIEQVPPMYSALKLNGQPLYKLARQGIEVERKPRRVTVYGLTLHNFEANVLSLSVSCSKGFYIRSLAMDIGSALGCGAHVQALRRTRVSDFKIEQAVTIDQLEYLQSIEDRQKLLIPTDYALGHLPKINLPDNIAEYFCQGQSVRVLDLPKVGMARLYAKNNKFLGLGEVTSEGKVAPKRLFV